MTYIISGHDPRAGLRGSVGGLGAAAPPALTSDDVMKAVGFSGQGDGSSFNPFGGVGGFGDKAEKAIAGFVATGIVFKPPPDRSQQFQQGFFNHEEYVTVVDQKGKFYKFKVTGTGIGREATPKQASDWFNGVNGAALAAKAVAPKLPGGVRVDVIDPNRGFIPTNISKEKAKGGSGDGGGTSTMVYVGGAAVLGLALLLVAKQSKKRSAAAA